MKRLLLLPFALCLLYLPSSSTVLGDLARSMKAGDWRELKTLGAVTAMGNAVNGATGNILPYSDDAIWEPNSHQLYFIGSDHQHGTGYARFVVYKETTNTWSELPRPTFFQPLTSTAMHGYDHSAINPSTGELYHRPFGAKRAVNRYYVPTNSWRAAFNIPTSLVATDAQMSCCIGVEFFPEYNGIVFVDAGNGAGNIFALSFKTAKWSMLRTGLAMGPYHNVAEYNPVYKVMIGGGGNGSSHVYKIDSTGAVTTQKQAPISYGTNQTVLTVDPVGGDYLLFNNAGQFWSYNVANDAWKQESGSVPVFTSNLTAISGVVATPVSSYGVTLFVACEAADSCRVMLYKRTAGSAVESARRGVEAPAIRVYPNPVSGGQALHLTLSGPDRLAGIVEIVDVRGKVIEAFSMESNLVWKAAARSGIYFVRWKVAGRVVAQEKIIRLG